MRAITPLAPAADQSRPPDLWLVGLGASRFFINLILMIYAASLPLLRTAWGMSATQAGSIATGFQIGYALSLFGFSALADRMGARRVMLVSATISAAATVAFALFARSYLTGLALYTLVALSQGGTYSAAIMLVAGRYDSRRRGAAMGWIIAASSFSHAASLAIAGVALPRGGYPLAFAIAAAGSVFGTAVAWAAVRTTPNVVHDRLAGVRVSSEVLRNPDARKLTVGYTFHSWELLGMWAWAPAFVAASLAATGSAAVAAAQTAAYVTSLFHVMGLLASSSMGYLSDRLGRRSVLVALAGLSTACSLTFGWLFGAPLAVLIGVGALYAFAGLGDSPVLSTALTEVVHPAALGAALALRSVLGFGAGAIAPLLFGAILDATNPPGITPIHWGWAFAALGAGGIIATGSAFGLKSTSRVQAGTPAAQRG